MITIRKANGDARPDDRWRIADVPEEVRARAVREARRRGVPLALVISEAVVRHAAGSRDAAPDETALRLGSLLVAALAAPHLARDLYDLAAEAEAYARTGIRPDGSPAPEPAEPPPQPGEPRPEREIVMRVCADLQSQALAIGMPTTRMCRLLGVAPTPFGKWENGEATPRWVHWRKLLKARREGLASLTDDAPDPAQPDLAGLEPKGEG